MSLAVPQTSHNTQAKSTVQSSDDEDDYQELPSGRDSDAHPASDADTDSADSDLEDGTGTDKDAAVLDEGVSDLDYLRSRVKAGVGRLDTEEQSSSQTSSCTDTTPGAHIKQHMSLYLLAVYLGLAMQCCTALCLYVTGQLHLALVWVQHDSSLSTLQIC